MLADHFLPSTSTAPFSLRAARNDRRAGKSEDGTKMLYESPRLRVVGFVRAGHRFGQMIDESGALVSMMVAAAVCVASMPLAGCARDAVSFSKARSAIVQADTAFERILPLLSPATAANVREGLAIADGAIGAARGATSDEDRALQLGRAAGAVIAIGALLKGH